MGPTENHGAAQRKYLYKRNKPLRAPLVLLMVMLQNTSRKNPVRTHTYSGKISVLLFFCLKSVF